MNFQHKQPIKGSDLRGFNYPLQALLGKGQAALERLQLATAALQTRLDQQIQQKKNLTTACQLQADELKRRSTKALDSQSYRASLLYMTQLQSQLAGRNTAIDGLKNEQRELKTAGQKLQTKLEGLQTHRKGQVKEYVLRQIRLDASEADRNWIMRNTAVASWDPSMGQGHPSEVQP